MPADGVITSYWGERTDPINGGGEVHKGVDIGIPEGTQVKAASDGTVTETGFSDSWGNYLRYRAKDGRVVIYAHLSTVLAKEKQHINQGDTVALSGNTGSSTGPHLHFGIYEQGKDIDPLSVVNNYSKQH